MPPACASALDSTVEVRFGAMLRAAASRAWLRCLFENEGSWRAEPIEVDAPRSASEGELLATLQALTHEVTQRVIAAQPGRLCCCALVRSAIR